MGTDLNACVILAAGKGTRMKSARPKVLHAIGGCSLVSHVIMLAKQTGVASITVVVGPGMDDVAAEVSEWDASAAITVQESQNGTADAVASARNALAGATGVTAVLYGDTPLITAETISRLSASLSQDGADLAVLGFHADDPTGYGRLVCDDDGYVVAIREEADANEQERALSLCNSGVIVFSSTELMFSLIDAIGNDNAKGEFYLTDAIEVAVSRGLKAAIRVCPESEVLGVNTRGHLAQAEAVLQERLRAAAMENGTTLLDPGSVYFSVGTELGRDVTVEPNVYFGPGVHVGDNVTVKAFSHLEGVTIREGASVGPFARLRPGADIGVDAKIGNFVEVKKAVIERGAKVNHLSYIGDAHVGAEANVGAGTITCNYDGFNKHKTEIGEGAFIGSNSCLVAPVKIGKNAYIGTGSVVTRNVSDDALALSRSAQVEKEGWAIRFQEVNRKRRGRT